MKCAWICFALFIANSAANEPYGGGGGGGGDRNSYGGGGVTHNLPNGVHMMPNGGGGVNRNFKGDAGRKWNY